MGSCRLLLASALSLDQTGHRPGDGTQTLLLMLLMLQLMLLVDVAADVDAGPIHLLVQHPLALFNYAVTLYFQRIPSSVSRNTKGNCFATTFTIFR